MALIAELKRRGVIKVGISYLIVAWLFIEVISTILPTFDSPQWILKALTAIAIMGFPVSIVLAWIFDFTRDGIVRDLLDAASTEQKSETRSTSGDHLARIAVLPLNAMSSVVDDQHLADGLTEDLTTLLSRTPGLFVIARNSCYVYKDRAVSVRQVAKELGVRYVVEGSARRFGDRIRTNIQLIDGETEEHVWAKRYDFSIESLFSTQEDISQKISAQLSAPIISAESERARRLPAEEIDAWLLTQRAILTYYFSGPEQSTADQSMELVEQALALEPNYPYALAFHAHMCTTTVALGFSDDLERDTKLAFSEIEKALLIAPRDPMVLWCHGVVQGFLGDLETAISTLKLAVHSNPNDAHALADLGAFLSRAGHYDEARETLERVFDLSPNEPRAYIWHFYLGANYFVSDLEAALDEFDKSLLLYPRYVPASIGKIVALGFMGRKEDARAAADKFKTIYVDTSAGRIAHLMRMGPIQDPEIQQKALTVLAEAGLGG